MVQEHFVICHPENGTTQFIGDRDVDWGHSHHEIDMDFGGQAWIGDRIYLNNWPYSGIDIDN